MQTDPPTAADEQDLEWAITRLREWVGVATVSTEGRAIAEGAAFTDRLLAEAGLATRTIGADGAPVVIGHRPPPPGRPTLLIYGHYDVQPPEPLADWHSPPFAAEIRGGAIWGRGAGDNKGQLIAHVAAVRSLIAAGELPLGITFVVEGEEEIGSPRLGPLIERHRDAVPADLAVTSDAPVHDDGSPLVIFGVRGLLYVQIDHRGATHDVHSGNRGGIAPSPAWELVEALARLRAPDGTVALDGFEESVRPPNDVELAMIAALPADPGALRRELGCDRLAPGAEDDPWRQLMFRPTCNLAGITSGYGGPGAKTIVPHRASCKIDFRLVADQDPAQIVAALRAWLARDLPGAELTPIATVPPSATDPGLPACRAVVEGVRAAHGRAPLLRPRLGGTTPDWVFTRVLGIPSVLVPYGPPDMSHHAPNERMTLRALRDGIRTSRAIYRAVARGAGAGDA